MKSQEIEELLKDADNFKQCRRCKEILPLTDFYRQYKNRNRTDGNYYQSYCKNCNLQNCKESKWKKGVIPQEELKSIAKNRVEKKCSLCGVLKPLIEFYKDKILLDGRSSACKECNLKAHAERVRKNKDIIVELMGGKCQKCGITPNELWPTCCFDLHHINPKEKDYIGTSLDKLIEESKKCILLCANCHRVEHCGY